MLAYVLNRLAQLAPVLVGCSLLVFLAVQLLPGDAAQALLGEREYTQEDYLAMRQYLGLDEPLHVQYFKYLGHVLQGDFGRSVRTHERVLPAILDRIPASLVLAASSLFVALAIGIPAGVISAVRPYSRIDQGSMVGALLGVSVPNFWLAIMLILVFSLYLGWLPASGRGSPPDFQHLILPSVVLGSGYAATICRLTRSCMLEVLNNDYIRTARAKGLREFYVVNKHAFRNALIPVVTEVGISLVGLLEGSTVIEVVFAWPGIARMAYQAALYRDYPMLQGCVLAVAFLFVAVNLLVDILYFYLDPRIKSPGAADGG
ncbi:MAG: ABC transporter permease [Deltaproteobacteria bacterium]|nr:ABC transporter permease [Deltaproteobacteria bacterium]